MSEVPSHGVDAGGEASGRGQRRVLIVDDSLTVRMDLKERFDEHGYATAVASTLAAARAALDDGGIDAILLDIQLPDGDGIDFLAELRAGPHAELPVVLLSARDDVAHRLRGLRVGAQDFAGKPYDGDSVFGLVERIVGPPQPDAGALASAPVLLMGPTGAALTALGSALAESSVSVVRASSAAQGLREAVRRRPAAIVVACELDADEGAELVAKVRYEPTLRDVPCLLLTRGADVQLEINALRAGADDVVDAQLGAAFVAGKVRALLRAAPARARGHEASALLRRILAVDDSETYLQAIAAELREAGYDVVLARSGEAALELLEVQAVDCVLLDRIMPGLSGEETVRQIRANPQLQSLPVLMLSAHEQEEAMLAGIRAGADDSVTKQGGFEVLKARVEAHLRRKQLDDENRRLDENCLRIELAARDADARHEREQAELRARMVAQVERANAELARKNAKLATQRNQLAQFAWLTSHDLQTPLRSVAMFSQLIERRLAGRLDAEAAADFEHLREGVARIRELINGLEGYLDAREGEAEDEHVDLNRCARKAFERLAAAYEAAGARFELGPLPSVLGARRPWVQVFSHLLDNALRYRGSAPLVVQVQSAPGDDGATVVSVVDNGVGFNPEHGEKIFNLFAKLHDDASGTGVGLSICRRVVEQHGGRIWFDAEPGRGASFHFTVIPYDS